jgi:hypothetical protein
LDGPGRSGVAEAEATTAATLLPICCSTSIGRKLLQPLAGSAAARATALAMALTVAMLCSWLTATASAQAPLLATPNVLDGPSSDIVSLDGLAVARYDGTGGLVYLKDVAGVQHVFVSRLAGGAFQAPTQIDAGLGGASSQPVIAAGQGGVLFVAFINGGELYVVDTTGSSAPWQSPEPIDGGAENPSISLDNYGVAYLAFTVAQGSGDDVLVAYYDGASWTMAQGPMNLYAGDDAGTGAGRPAVAAAGDGVGIVTWGENGHVYARRVWATSPSVEYEQADVASLGGWNEDAAGEPAISVGGDSSYVDIAFDEKLQSGSQTQTRVLMTRLVAEDAQAPVAADGLATPGSESADQPAVAMNEYGRGFVTSAGEPGNELFADVLGTNGGAQGVQRVDSLANDAPPYAAPAIAGLTSTLIAWQQTSGLAVTAQIHLRYAVDGSDLGPEQVASGSLAGYSDAAEGLEAGGDGEGDAVVAWVQSLLGGSEIVTAQMFVTPGTPEPSISLAYTRTANPVLRWSAAREKWGPLTYTVTIDGQQVAQTTATSVTVPTVLNDGPHKWQVTATNLGGGQTFSRTATIFVDTVPPRVSFTLKGRDRVGRKLTMHVSFADLPPPQQPGAKASGVKSVLIRWGDGSKSTHVHVASHVYARRGRYLIKVTVTDRAGNATTVARVVRIRK